MSYILSLLSTFHNACTSLQIPILSSICLFSVLSSTLQVSPCPHLSLMRRCFHTLSSRGRSPLRVICPLRSLR